MFAGKVVLITGASSGFGAATAVHFAKHGALLALTGRDKQNLEAVAQKCEEGSKVKPLIIVADLIVDSDVKKIVDSVIETYGKLDILINNAGIFGLGTIENTNIQQYDKIFGTNVRAVYLLTTLAVPYLIEAKGNIVNVSSIAGLRSGANILAYSMSKAALDQFTRCVALDLAPKQVRVNSVNPGVVETNIQRRAGFSEEDTKKLIESCKFTHPLGRAGKIEEVVEAISYLASDKASFTTGETLTVDGGLFVSMNFDV